MEHELFEVVMEDGVLDVPEHQPDVLCVDGRGEVVVQGLLGGIASLGPEALDHERLDVRQTVLRPGVLGKVVFERNALHLLLQQVRLVEEEDDRNVDEDAVVDDGLEDVERFTQPVGQPVLHQHLLKTSEVLSTITTAITSTVVIVLDVIKAVIKINSFRLNESSK